MIKRGRAQVQTVEGWSGDVPEQQAALSTRLSERRGEDRL